MNVLILELMKIIQYWRPGLTVIKDKKLSIKKKETQMKNISNIHT